MPARSTALMCTNTSFDPSVGWMKPNPFCELKNFTVPVAIMALLLRDTPVNPTHDHRAPGKASEFWGMTWERPKSSVSRQAENQGCGRSLAERRYAVKRSSRALELALLRDALVRLARALDAILLLVALGRQHADNLVDAGGVTAAEQACDDVNIVADAKLVSQVNLLQPTPNRLGAAAAAHEPPVLWSMSL